VSTPPVGPATAQTAKSPAETHYAWLRRAFRTFGWAAVSQFGRQALQLGGVIVLARLLPPQDFGVMSLAMVVIGFIALFRDMGTGAALIQSQGISARLAPSLFSFNALLSLVCGLCTAALAPLAATFFEAPVLEPVLQVLAVSLAVAGLGVVPQAVMEREGRFDLLARIELLGVAAGVATGISMAYAGWGVWSLVGQALVTTTMTTALLAFMSGTRPTLQPDWRLLRSIAGYSLNLAGFNIFNYLVRNADNAIIGKLLGSRELGYYALAYQLAIGPVRSINGVIHRVLFPALARVREDQLLLGKEYLRGVSLLVGICFPLMAMLVALAEVATLAVLGESWRPMVPILVVLGMVGFVQSTSNTLGLIFMTVGRTDILMRIGLATGTVSILAFWLGAQWSALGVALAYAAVTLADTYPCLRIGVPLVGVRVRDIWRISARPAIASFVAGLIAWLLAHVTQEPLGTMGALIAGGAAGVLSYMVWYLVPWSALPLSLNAPRMRR
jgi:PST family polysaccharide transporter